TAVKALDRVFELSRPAIRERFEQRFTARRMANNYVSVYRELIEAAEPLPRLVARLRAVRDSFGLSARQSAAVHSAADRVSGRRSQTRAKPAMAMAASPEKVSRLPK